MIVADFRIDMFFRLYSKKLSLWEKIRAWTINGKLIPTRLAILWGRYVEFHILPYSYAEYLQLMQQPAGRASYWAYLQKGGLPELYNLPTVESEKQYVASVKDMILLRDISPFVI